MDIIIGAIILGGIAIASFVFAYFQFHEKGTDTLRAWRVSFCIIVIS